jgi:hypothetical protein
MDWLRSEDLKGEKNVIAPESILAFVAPADGCAAERCGTDGFALVSPPSA